jgi:hypothetical protein
MVVARPLRPPSPPSGNGVPLPAGERRALDPAYRREGHRRARGVLRADPGISATSHRPRIPWGHAGLGPQPDVVVAGLGAVLGQTAIACSCSTSSVPRSRSPRGHCGVHRGARCGSPRIDVLSIAPPYAGHRRRGPDDTGPPSSESASFAAIRTNASSSHVRRGRSRSRVSRAARRSGRVVAWLRRGPSGPCARSTLVVSGNGRHLLLGCLPSRLGIQVNHVVTS